MEPRLQRRVQRYGWDLAAADYEPLWGRQIAPAHRALLRAVRLRPGERVLDVACGTGLVSLAAARAVGPRGQVVGVDISGRMVEEADRLAAERAAGPLSFARMDAEALSLPDGGFDVALCALGLMYAPTPETALAEMVRVLRPGGRVALAVWGARGACGWSPVFQIVDAEVQSDVCPLFFRLGQGETLAEACRAAGLVDVRLRRLPVTLDYASADTACDAAFIGGPVALAWSRFDPDTRARVRRSYLEAIAPWTCDDACRIPAEFVIVTGVRPLSA